MAYTYLSSKLILPKNIGSIFNLLKSKNIETYIVGGAIRDTLLNRKPHDFDFLIINTSLEEVMKIFSNTPFKVQKITLSTNENILLVKYERGKYLEISFDSNLDKNLANRDLRINSCYFDGEKFLNTLLALEDLKNKSINFNKNVEVIIKHDPLRMLRAIRFALTLNFKLSEECKNNIHKFHYLIKEVNKDRIKDEFNKIIIEKGVSSYLSEFSDLFGEIFSIIKLAIGYNQNTIYHQFDLYTHELKVVEYLNSNFYLRFAGFFHDCAKPICKTIDKNTSMSHYKNHDKVGAEIIKNMMKEFHYDNKSIKIVYDLIYFHMANLNDIETLCFLLNKIGKEEVNLLLLLKEADFFSKKDKYDEQIKNNFAKDIITKIDRLYKEGKILKAHDLKIDGEKIKDILNIKEGKLVGKIIKEILDLVRKGEIKNEEKILENYLIKKYKNN